MFRENEKSSSADHWLPPLIIKNLMLITRIKQIFTNLDPRWVNLWEIFLKIEPRNTYFCSESSQPQCFGPRFCFSRSLSLLHGRNRLLQFCLLVKKVLNRHCSYLAMVQFAWLWQSYHRIWTAPNGLYTGKNTEIIFDKCFSFLMRRQATISRVFRQWFTVHQRISKRNLINLFKGRVNRFWIGFRAKS